jgi:hypothetical protein
VSRFWSGPSRKALTVKLPDAWSAATAVFDDPNVVSYAGLPPVLALAERAGMSELTADRVRFNTSRVKPAGVNSAGN